MTKLFRYSSLLLPIILLLTIQVIAQDSDGAGASTFAGRPTLWVAVIIGVIASAVTLVYAYQLRDGIVGKALYLIGAGMALVALGFLAVVVQWADASVQAIVHDIAFIVCKRGLKPPPLGGADFQSSVRAECVVW